jgi:hypothetical protein
MHLHRATLPPVMASSAPQPVHWSKDFVEHLRTVHFALIAVSAGLIALILSARTYNPAVAARELAEIRQLQDQWSRRWVGSNTLFDVMSSIKVNIRCRSALRISIPREPNTRALLGTVVDRGKKTRTVIAVTLPTATWFTSGNLRDSVAYSPISGPELTLFPKHLSSFREWWDSLNGNNRSVLIPFTMEAEGMGPPGGTRTLLLEEEPNMVLPNSQPFALTLAEYSDSDIQAILSARVAGIFSFKVCSLGKLPIKQDDFTKIFPDWRTGNYRAAFYDLDEAAREYGSLSFDQVSTLLAADSSKTQDVLEVFGMKFPAGQITFWGDILILNVQLYFLVYLRRLSGKLNRDDSGWDVPWIGMDSSMPSRMMSYASFVILPVVAAVFVGWQGAIRAASDGLERTDRWYWFHLRQGWSWSYAVRLEVAVLVLAIFASAYLALQSWKYRPRVAPESPTPPSAPTQVME